MRMNNETKLLFALENILHLEDLIEGNEWEKHLQSSFHHLNVRFSVNFTTNKLKEVL